MSKACYVNILNMLFLLHRVLLKPESMSSIKQSQEIKWTQKSSLKVVLAFKNIKNNIAMITILLSSNISIFAYLKGPIHAYSLSESHLLFAVQLPEELFPCPHSSFTQTLHCSTKTAPRNH